MNKKQDFIYILGPCSLQDEESFFKILNTLRPIMKNEKWWMKASFDKANRTSIHGGRGCGLSKAIEIWKTCKQQFPEIQLITDVHECWQVKPLVGVVDAIQIPAFLARQTDLVIECAMYFDVINIKKPQWLGPNNLKVLVDKVRETNPNAEAWLSDRGSNLGYDHLILDFTYVEEMKNYYDRVLIDCTHSTQRSKAIYGVQGDRKLAMKYFLSAPIFGYDGLFAETHFDPSCSVSDGDCMIELQEIEGLMEAQFNINQSFKQTFPKGI